MHPETDNTMLRTEKRNNRRDRLLLLLVIFVSGLFIFRHYIFGDQVLVFMDIGSDTYQLYTLQFASIIRHLREGTFALWDFTNGFGVNQFNMNLFDPSLMLVYGIGYLLGPDRVLYFLPEIQILRMMAAGWAFWHFMNCFSFRRQSKFAASFCYGLCGYLMVWGQHSQFGMAVVYLPLLLLFTEKYVQGKRSARFLPLIVFLQAIYSCFFSYMSLATVGLYLIGRLAMQEKLSFSKRILRFLGGCMYIVLGLLLAMAVFLPMAVCMLTVSGRVDGGSGGLLGLLRDGFTPLEPAYYQSVLLRLFSSNLQITYGLSDAFFEPWKNFYEDPALFVSALSVLLNVQFLFMYRRKEPSRRKKIVVYVTAALLAFGILLPMMGTIYNAFSYFATRFFYVMAPFFLLGMAWTWDRLREGEKLNRPALVISGLVMCAVYVTGFRQSIFRELRINAAVLMGTGLLMSVCLFLWQRGEEKKKARVELLLVGLVLVHMISEGSGCFEDRASLRKTDTPPEQLAAAQAEYESERDSGDDELEAYASLKIPQGYFGALYSQNIQDAIAYLNETDPEFFRMEKDFLSASQANDAMAQGYYGVSSYNAVMNQNIRSFAKNCAKGLRFQYMTYYLQFMGNEEDNTLAAFMGIRYLLSRDGNLLPSKYEQIGQFGDLYLYRNKADAAMGRFFDKTISRERFKKTCKSGSRDVGLYNALCLEGIKDTFTWEELKNVSEEMKNSTVTLDRPEIDSRVTGRVHAETDGYVEFMVPFENGWHAFVDDEEVPLLQGDIGFCACAVPKGDHTLRLQFEAPGLGLGILLSGAAWCVYLLMLLHRPIYRKKKTQG